MKKKTTQKKPTTPMTLEEIWKRFENIGFMHIPEKDIEQYDILHEIFWCSSPLWDLKGQEGEYLEYVQYCPCQICHKWVNPIILMSNNVAIRENMDYANICRMCYPDAIHHKKAPVDNRQTLTEYLIERGLQI